jgi:glyoxylase-like metal-dependent hydrolase (beta-lactamase superfamily II)
MSNPISQVLILRAGQPLLVRTLLRFDAPFQKYPHFGVWSYLFDTPSGVVVFDTGPYYNSLLGIIRRSSGNTDLILTALKKYFPQKTVSQIWLSHYHFDHSENAPHLQKQVKKLFNNCPPIRLHQNDLEEKKYLLLFRKNLEKIYRQAGHPSWLIGSPLVEGEELGDSSFSVLLTPGHTTGTIALISHQYRTMVTGWPKINSPLLRTFQNLANEDPADFSLSFQKTPSDYQLYSYHPALPKTYPLHRLFP